jgi:predicted enzyme related to lactoylglutathione lyase
MGDDLKSAVDFYTGVVGWSAQDAGMAEFPYQIFSTGSTMVAGMMDIPDEARAMGARPSWLGYIWVEDVDKALAKLTAAGGKVYKPPADIPGVGRFAVVGDPDGATFLLFRDAGGDPPPPLPPGTPGLVGWRELNAGDGAGAFAFYAGQFGWKKDGEFDMGPMGVYHLFDTGRASRAACSPRRPIRPNRSGSIISMSRASTPGSASQKMAGASSTDRWRFRAANGSSKRSIRRARCSRSSRRSAKAAERRPWRQSETVSRKAIAMILRLIRYRLVGMSSKSERAQISHSPSSPMGRAGNRRLGWGWGYSRRTADGVSLDRIAATMVGCAHCASRRLGGRAT